MGPDRKENLKAHDARERERQELEMLLADSNRLVREMQLLAAQSAELARQHAELAKHHAELLITLKGLKQRPKR